MRSSRSGQINDCATLVDVLRWRAAAQPRMQGYTFLADGAATESSLTYAELDRQARAIAVALRLAGAAGERVLLLYPPGLEFIAAFFGCLYAEAVAVPAYAPAAHRPIERLQVIAADAQARAALTTSALKMELERAQASLPNSAWPPVVASDTLPTGTEELWQPPRLTGDSLALLQYTSGSTGTPRGVMVTHSNLLDNLELIRACVATSPATPGVSWLPMFHDMGLLCGVLVPLYTGLHVTLMSPISFLQRPFRWLQAVSRRRAVITGAPNFALDLCVRRTTMEQRATLDLSCLKVLFVSAEPVRPEALDRFSDAFAPCGFCPSAFYPCYGLAEATMLVAGGERDAPPVVRRFTATGLAQNHAHPAGAHDAAHGAAHDAAALSLVGCGHTRPNHPIAVMDPATGRRCAANEVGEIWVAGPSVAQGYWRLPLETMQTFQAYTADTNEGPFLRTGDLGFFDGDELFVTGRLKEVIIIRGVNRSPQELEATMQASHSALRPGCGAAFTVEVEGEDRLVMVQEAERSLRPEDTEAVVGAIRQHVAEAHGLQVYAIALIRPGTIPKTTSGKIQRIACRERFVANALETIASSRVSEA